jgi:predicted SnoaL-like aldol condensation-catalyzing enzyme
MPAPSIGNITLSSKTAWRACGSSSPGSWPIIRTRGEIKRVFADGNYVILHSRWHGLSDNPRGEAVVDIFRLENGKMVEHWEVIQPIPEMAANNNTMF